MQIQFPVVGVGASAGGLRAISDLLAALPAEPGFAVVVVSHQAPGRESILDILLAAKTRLPVHQVRNGEAPEPNRVYVGPPGKQVLFSKGLLRLVAVSPKAQPVVIDRFFSSLAAGLGEAARGVVLSGTGGDGTLGLTAIRGGGGTTFAQEPDSAEFPQMPSTAIAAGCVDHVLPPVQIARHLVELPRVTAPAAAPPALKPGSDIYAEIIESLPPVVGVDFSQYKTSTLRRRIAKRMAQQGFSNPQAYLQHLKAHPSEARALFTDLLIRVSSFFRDPEAFQALQRKVVVPLLRHADPRKPIRVWVPGCARGEEVYSIGMLLLERAGRRSLRFQLFGTDLSAPDIDAARAGRFPETTAMELSPARLKRFFDKVPGGYQVRPELRELCVFACQEVGNDPPFSNLDLVSCRNLLIYFARPLQDRVIETFHYALKPGGALFLGRSESLGGHTELFSLVDSKYRIYRRKPNGDNLRRLTSSGPNRAAMSAQVLTAPNTPGAPRAIERFMLERYAPPGLYIDEDLVIRAFIGDVSAYLHTTSGQANLHLGRLLPTGMALDIRTAIRAARKSARPVQRETTWIGPDGSARDVSLLLSRINEVAGSKPGYLVLFEHAVPKEAEAPARGKPRQRERNELARVNKLLAATREQLQTVLEEQEQAAEELRAAHEEALSGNEELQSSNEELQTAKEELQSANEELATVNEELQDRNQQLDRLAAELSTLIAGVNIPIVHLDRERRVRRFSPAARSVFNLIASDTGREFAQIKPSLALPELDTLITAALERGTVTEREVEDRTGHWYSLRVRPFRDSGNHIEGALIALVDIDATKRNIAAIVETMSEPLLALDRELRVVTANPAFYRTFRTAERNTHGVSLFELGNRQWDVPELRRQIEDVLPKRKQFQGYRMEQQFPLIGRRVFQISGKQIVDEGMGAGTVLLMFQDVTDSEVSAERLREAREQEEQRIANELHDLSGGALAVLSMELAQLADQAVAPVVAQRLRKLRKQVQQLSSSTHDLARRIHPSVVEDLGLRKALQGECAALEERPGIHTELNVSGRAERLPDAVNLCLYRVTQEALRNAARHSRARKVSVSLAADVQEARLEVRDDGKGFDVEAARVGGGMGLIGIADRVHAVNGKLSVTSAPGKGTTISVVIPLASRLLQLRAGKNGGGRRKA